MIYFHFTVEDSQTPEDHSTTNAKQETVLVYSTAGTSAELQFVPFSAPLLDSSECLW